MSIEYTIDIQLTELGFPDILQPRETSVRETPCRSTSPDDSLSPSHPPTSLSDTHKPKLLVRVQQSADGKEAGAPKQTSNVERGHCKPVNPAQSVQGEQAVRGTALVGPSEPAVHDPCAVSQITDPQQLITEQGDNGEKAGVDGGVAQEDVEDECDDSEDSQVNEEEEVDEEEDYEEEEEEEEEEEGLNNESSHSGDYHCSVCGLQLPSKFKLQDHMNLHTGARPYCCAECGKRFCQIYNYRVHLRTHAQTKVDRLMCRICLRSFSSQEDLNDHLSRTHFEKEFYECDLCKRVFTSLKACENHVQLHKDIMSVICNSCGRNFSSPKSLARHRRRMCLRNFKCTDCGNNFTKKNALLKHSFSHLGLLPYTCLRCRCHFRLAKLYRQHKCEPERIHCVACLREFLSQEDFQQHKKDTGCWGNQEPKSDEIRCLECGQRFDTSEELKKHAGAHQRVLKCAECGKGFRSALLLMSHMGGHVGKSPCLCQSCGLGFPHQQNYDSHLKTCGQTPQPATAPKKRQASKGPSPETKKFNAKQDSSSPTNTATMPAAPVKDSSSPGCGTNAVSPSSGPADGLWKLTLDKQPPPGVKLVLFLPVCPTQTESLSLNAADAALVNAPLGLVTGIKQDPVCEAPLDLSKKCNSSKSALSNIPPLPIKSEPGEYEISGEADITDRQEFKNSNSETIVQSNPGREDAFPEVKKFKMDPIDLSLPNANTTSSGLTLDIKNEPQSPGLGHDSWSPRTCQLTENEIKVEVDVSSCSREKKT